VALLGFGGEILWAVARIWPWKGAWLVELHRAWLWLGQAPAWFETLMIMRWVVLWGLLALLYLRVRGRLERDVGVALGFLLLLALVTVYEYHFELHAFRRSGAADRVVAPFLFGAWILWLCYSVGMRAASGDSPRWSREGRTGLYAGGMVLVATALHLAAVALASTLADRTFLQLFLGLMHVGIPYALYVYLGKRHAAERPSTARLLGAFLLGIATHVPVLLLTKLALGGYTTAGFLGVVETVRESLLTRGFGPEDLSAPDAPGFVALAVSVGFACRLLALAAVRPGPVTAAAVFLGYGVGGVMPLSLPLLPSSVMAALLPLERHLTLTLSLASHHALHLLLALTVAGLYRLRGRSGLATGLAVAFMLELGVTLLSVVGGDYLRSTGLSWSLLVAVAGAAGLLLWRINRLSGEGTLVPASHVWVVVGVGLVAVLGASARSAYRHRLLPARIGDVSFGVPAPWKRLPRPPPGVAQAWTRHHAGGAALLLVSVEPLAAGATLSAHLEGADRQLAATVRGFRVLRSRGGPDRRRRRVQLRLPGDRWPRKGEQLVLRRRGTAISWAYLAPTLSFQALLPDARRVLASVDARQVLTTLER
jgi:F0F1-type ATP synthase assembly protein I